jgi:signal transduction histidine kinase
MRTNMARLAWLTILGISILAVAGIAWTLWITRAPTEYLRAAAVSVVWLNFGLQMLLLALAVVVAARFLSRDRKRRAEQARTEHLAEVALLAGGLAHEVRNHLHALQSRVGLLRKSLSGNEAALRRIERLDEITDGMEQLVTNFLTLARPATDELEQLNPADLIREVIDFERSELDRLGIDVDLELQDDFRLLVDRGKLKRALLNVVVNARQAMPNGGKLRIYCGRRGDVARIVVEDNGDGIPPDVLPRIFESYFTTKPEGSGLGLAIVRRTIEDLGGKVACNSSLGKGTTITFDLPQRTKVSPAKTRDDKQFALVGQGVQP